MKRLPIFTVVVFLAGGCAGNFDPDLGDTGTGVDGSTGEGSTTDDSTTGSSTTGMDETGSEGSTTGTTDASTTDTSTTDASTTAETTDTGMILDMGDTGADAPGLGEKCHFLHDQCEDGLTCVKTYFDINNPVFYSWVCFDYTGEGSGDLGEPCDTDYDCTNGFVCAAGEYLDNPPLCDTTNGNAGCCTPYCESDAECPNGLHCYWLNITWNKLDPEIQQYGYPRLCVDDTWPQKMPPP